jgi:ATP-dependent exoDNAse (exonuclease V) alpha subunit
MRLLNNMPIIARINNKSYDICNNELFTIKKITSESITIQDEAERVIDVPIKVFLFQRRFYPAFCITIHKSQGSTFDHEYTIHEFEHPGFDERLKYVALSRSSSIKHINRC